MLIVHHGLFWDGTPRRIRMLERRRLETLFRNDLSLVAYHLPLDGHDELGNNAVLAALLGLEQVEPFGDYRGRLLGRYGMLPAPEPATRAGGPARRGDRLDAAGVRAAAPTRSAASA